MELQAGCTNELTYYFDVSGTAAQADSITLAVTDESGNAISVSDTPTWDSDASGYDVTLASDEVTSAYVGTTWTLTWSITYSTATVTDVEYADVVAGLDDSPYLIVDTNSYLSLPDAESYFAKRLYTTAWDEASEGDKARSLAMATSIIDSLPLEGRKYTTTQTLEFPRTYLHATVYWMGDMRFTRKRTRSYRRIGAITWGDYTYDVTSVPQKVKDAVCEEAMALLDRGDSERLRLQDQGVRYFTLGSLSEQYRSRGENVLLSRDARRLMRDYIAGSVPLR